MGRFSIVGTLTKRASALVATVLLAAGAVVFPGSSVHAASNGDWSAFPQRPAKAGPLFTPRQYFFFDLAAGTSVRDTVTIKNSKTTPIRLQVYPADAFNVRAGGGFALTPQNKPQKDVGTWVKLGKTSVIVPPTHTVIGKNGQRKVVIGQVNIPFTLTVPRTATPGDHAGGIVTIEPTPTTSITQPSGAVIAVRRSLAVRIYTRVSGPLNPQLLISNVRYVKLKPATMPLLGDQGGAAIEYTYVNNGNVRITPKTTISYKGFLGRTLHSGRAATPEILPGQTITLTDAVVGMPVLDQVTARVQMQGDTTSDKTLGGLTAAGDIAKWCVSWVFVIVVIALILALIVWRARRSRKTKAPVARGKRARTDGQTTPA